MNLAYILLFLFLVLLILSGCLLLSNKVPLWCDVGKFIAIRNLGFTLKFQLSIKFQDDQPSGLQLDVIVETKTKDDVFVKLKVSVNIESFLLKYEHFTS